MKYCMGCMEQYEDEYQVCPHCGYVEGTTAEESYYMEPGTILNKHYIVGKVIGTGGFGTTYIGWDYELGRKVAIKEYLPKEFSTRVKGAEDITVYPGEKEEQFQAGIEKFIEEAGRLVKFKSIPGIVKFYNCFEENKTAYIIMEYLEGETLKEYLVRNREERLDTDTVYCAMPYGEARKIMDSLLDALEAVHKEGIIHRDIAPDNVFITKEGNVKLIDFGSSRFATTRHSRSLTVLIKEGYAPQEQYRSRGDQGPWTDVYSVAATFYTMVTGRIPQDAMEREGNDEVKPPSKLGVKGIPKHVENAVMNALNRKIEDRTQSCEEFKEQLSDENTKWNFIRQRKVDIGKWPLWLKVTSGAGGAAVASFIILLITGVISFSSIMSAFVSRSEVPFVVGDSKQVAEETLKDAGFECVYANYVEDEAIAKDCIFNQMPGANEELAKGEAVYLSISCGSIKKEMPNLIGYDAEKAQQILDGLNLSGLEVKTVSVTDPQKIAGAGANTVVCQMLSGAEVQEGTEVKDGMVVTLEVAAETKSETSGAVTAPNVIGQSFLNARGTASKSKVLIRKANAQYSDQPKDTVLSQSVEAGQQIEQNGIIDVTVSAGSDIIVGIYQGKKKEDVVVMLEEAGIQAEWSEQESKNVPAGRVISQSVEPGGKIKYSDKLKLVVSTGSKDVKVDEDKINELEKNKPSAAPTAPPQTVPKAASKTPGNTSKSGNQISGKPDKDRKKGNDSGKAKEKSTPKPTKKPEAKPTEAVSTSVPKSDNMVAVPDVRNKGEGDAGKVLKSSKLNYKTTYEFSNTVSEGKVIGQTPSMGKVTEGTIIALVVSKGKKAPDGWTTETGFSSRWYSAEKKKQYCVATREKKEEKKSSDKSNLDGWTLYDTKWGDYGAWSAWSRNPVSGSESRKVEKKDVSNNDGYVKYYYYRFYSKSAGGWLYSFENYAGSEHRTADSRNHSFKFHHKTYGVDGYVASPPIYHKDELWFKEADVPPTTHKEYRYQDRKKIYYFKRTVYGEWSDGKWTDEKSKESDTKKVTDERLLYQYTEK